MKYSSALVGFLLLLSALPVRGHAQGFQFTWPEARRTVSVGDVDADGFDEIARGRSDFAILPTIELRSGRTGAILYTLTGASSNDALFGESLLGLGDVDHDGRPDFVTIGNDSSLPNPNNYLSARSGPTGSEIWNVAFPAVNAGGLARLKDLDGDGADDFATALFSLPRVVSVRSGATGFELLSIPGTPDPGLVFAGLAAAGDIDLDGWEDLLVSSFEFPGTSPPQGRVDVHSGRTGAILLSIPTPNSTAYGFGSALAAVGDVSGDGIPDFMVASPDEPVGVNRWGRVRLFSGANGAVLQVVTQSLAADKFGESVARFPDFDGDGRDDMLIAAGNYRAGCCSSWPAEVRIYSSGTGQMLHLGETHRSSPSITVVRDANGDGRDDYLVPYTYSQYGIPAGGFSALALTGQSSPSYDLACLPIPTPSGCPPYLFATGAPSPTRGDDFTLRASYIPPSSTAWFFWGRSSTSVPFASGQLCVASPWRRWGMLNSTSGGSGCAAGPVMLPLSKSDLAATGMQAGQVLHVQCFYRDSGLPPSAAAGLTNAILVTLWP